MAVTRYTAAVKYIGGRSTVISVLFYVDNDLKNYKTI